MKYAVLYDSHSGNTAHVAQAIRDALPEDELLCFYSTIEAEKHPDVFTSADLIFYGFWTDQGNCPEASQQLLPNLPATNIALFATAGFGEGDPYFQTILHNTSAFLPKGATLVGTFMCTGKMPLAVREKYASLLENPSMKESATTMLHNYDLVEGHPNEADLQNAAAFAKAQYTAVQK